MFPPWRVWRLTIWPHTQAPFFNARDDNVMLWNRPSPYSPSLNFTNCRAGQTICLYCFFFHHSKYFGLKDTALTVCTFSRSARAVFVSDHATRFNSCKPLVDQNLRGFGHIVNCSFNWLFFCVFKVALCKMWNVSQAWLQIPHTPHPCFQAWGTLRCVCCDCIN